MCQKYWPVTLLNRFLDLLMTGEPPVNDTKINNSNGTISHARENNDPHSYCCPCKLKKAQIPPTKPSHLSLNTREYIISPCCHMFSPTTNPTVDMITDCTAFRNYAPNFEKVGDILVSACPCVCVCVCVCVCIYVRDIVLKLHVWIPHGKIADAYFWFSLNYLPLSNYGPLTNKGMKFCICRISKSIIARNFKLVMLIGDDD